MVTNGNVAPVLAAGRACRPRGLGLVQHGAAETHAECRGRGWRSGSPRFSLLSEPSRSTTVPVGRPNRPCRRDLDGDEIAVLGAGGRAGRDGDFAAELLLVDRHQPAAAARHAAENAEHAVLGAIDELDDAAARFPSSPDFSMRISARSPTPATSPGLARRGVAMWMTGGAPCASSSHSVGRAKNSPSLSRPVMSASTTGGSVPA